MGERSKLIYERFSGQRRKSRETGDAAQETRTSLSRKWVAIDEEAHLPRKTL